MPNQDSSPTGLPKTGAEDAFTHRQWIFYIALGSICLLAIIQFAFFPPYTTADRAMSVGQSKEQLARERAAKIRQEAQAARDDQGKMCFIDNRGFIFHQGKSRWFGFTYWNNPSQLIGLNFLSVYPLKASDAGTYTCRVSNEYGSVTSNGATVTMLALPEITEHPQDAAINEGASVTLTVTASGNGLHYVWRKDGQVITGATNASYPITNAVASHAGAYTCVISNDYGTVISQTATVKVKILPVITVHPVNRSSTPDGDVIFSVTATSPTPISYQWQRNDGNMTGATGITIASLVSKHDTASRKWLKDVAGNWCFITPQGILFHGGKPFSFGVSYWNNPALLIGPNYLALQKVGAGDIGSYRCVVSNEFGSRTSNPAVLAIVAPPRITGQPQSQTVTQNKAFNLSVTAEGDNLEYQWLKNNVSIANATKATLTINNAQVSDSGSYTCRVSNANGAVTSQAAEVMVITMPVINLHPVDTNATRGTHVAIVSRATGGQITRVWEKSEDGNNWLTVNGAEKFEISATFEQYNTTQRKWLKDFDGTWCFLNSQGNLYRRGTQIQLGTKYWTNPSLLVGSSLLLLKNAQPSDSASYRLKASNTAGSVTSNPATLTISN